MDKDPELEQVIVDALSLEEDYPHLYCPSAYTTCTTFFLETEIIQKPLDDPNKLQETLAELYAILGIPQEPPIARPVTTGTDQSTPSMAGQEEQLTRQQPNGGERTLTEENGGEIPSTTRRRSRRRTLYSKEQIRFLKNQFMLNPQPDYQARCCFSEATKIPEHRIQVWFQNRRARHLRKASKEQQPP
ncbi:homeobox protein siamois-like [Leptodactylus fuscus]|uniref:homeobox protein siamois-like n=1 Tax=Leptodactylus fuscus TaxID=238119 RepID=UPI003F4ECA2A